jgi:hypothetical protein
MRGREPQDRQRMEGTAHACAEIDEKLAWTGAGHTVPAFHRTLNDQGPQTPLPNALALSGWRRRP